MFKKIAALLSTQNIHPEWNLHYGAHCHWRNDVYTKFDCKNVHEVLNKEPAIDHENVYNSTISDYFKSGITLTWIDQNFDQLSHNEKIDAKRMVGEAAAIYAAHAMCHPRDRVGKFDWSDVLSLHECLRTPYLDFIKKHNLSSW
jgi:hypothetical protein